MVYNNGKPKMCNLAITLDCMLKCKICYHWQNDEKNIIRPNLDEWKRFIFSLKNEVSPDFIVSFGGGEPLLFPEDLIALISFCSELGFRTALSTSGHTIDIEYAERLAKSGLDYINLTIFSLNNSTHDFLRGVNGSLEKALEAIDYLGRFKGALEIGINTIIMKPSLDSLLELTEWVNNDSRLSGIYYQVIMRPFHTPLIEEWHKIEKYQFLWPDDLRKLEYVIDTLIAFKQKGYRISNPISQFSTFKAFFKNPSNFIKPFTCNLVNGNFFTIESDGTIKLCPYMESLGKITEGNFQQLWYLDHTEKVREKISQCKTNCHHLINCWYEEDANEQNQEGY